MGCGLRRSRRVEAAIIRRVHTMAREWRIAAIYVIAYVVFCATFFAIHS